MKEGYRWKGLPWLVWLSGPSAGLRTEKGEGKEWDGVTMQTGFLLLGTLTYDLTICFEENRFLLTTFQTWGTECIPAWSPFLPWDPELPLLPKRLQAKTLPRSSPFPYLSLRQSYKQISVLSGMCNCGFQSTSSHKQLSFKIWGVLFSVFM